MQKPSIILEKVANSRKHVIINLKLNLQRLTCQVRKEKKGIYIFLPHTRKDEKMQFNLLNLIRNYGLSNTVDKWKDIHQHNQN